MTLNPGTRLGPYEVIEPLGSGGMGEVYRARDPRLGRDVAIKLVTTDGEPSADRLRRFETEARAVARLSHPNVITVLDVGTHDGRPYLVLELLEGETLRGALRGGGLSVREAVECGLGMARGLGAAHERGIVHRDLKPENVFVTVDGRVKVLDFGLAKFREPLDESGRESPTESAQTRPGTLVGTVAYMSPEQVRGQSPDARSDVFALGAVLYELVTGRRAFEGSSRSEVLASILRDEPTVQALGEAGVPGSLEAVIRRCLAKRPAERFASGGEVAAALETVLASLGPGRVVAARRPKKRGPYPGLESFRESDAESFFGREAEVEALWEKLPERRLLAVIGPSGVGKTSFIHAGVVPSRPEGWGAIVSTPGRTPMTGLAQALAPEVAGDAEAVKELLRFEDPDVAFAMLRRWRQGFGEALLVVDQFEELFTLAPEEAQGRFAALLGRVAHEGDIHVVLSLRDDFLMRCGEHEELRRVFTELTPLLRLSGESLRRALEEPARREGLAFEEGLVDEMREAVEGARGALPLLAFAVSRLWEKRDREKRLLTRRAYEEIGGVAGALAQHAEHTLERIGADKQSLVREIFRNLVTAEGTRASSEREELLSVFGEKRAAAEEVLGELIDARLLTSYEATEREWGTAPSSREAAAGTGDEGSAGLAHPGVLRQEAHLGRTVHRIEVVHESLLRAWPRLVMWQAQEEEGAVLRDQLKQAARLWEEKGRPDDLLWTGTSEREFEVWRERYPGQLTAVEDAFAEAMVARARRRQRLRRVAVAATIVGLSVVAGAIAVSRHKEAQARQEAEAQAQRAEAGKLLALGQTRIEEAPTEALAYALASLERADTEDARLFVLKVLAKGPPARLLKTRDGTLQLTFSHDGQWLAAPLVDMFVWPRDGGPVKILKSTHHRNAMYPLVGFTRPNDLLAVDDILADDTSRISLWSLPEGKLERTLEFDGPTYLAVHTPQMVTATLHGDQATGRLEFQSWPSDGGDAKKLGSLALKGRNHHREDPTGTWLAVARDRVVQLLRLAALGKPPVRVIPHPATVRRLAFDATGERLATADADGTIRIWNLENASSATPRVLRRPADGTEDVEDLGFTSDGSRLRASGPEHHTFLWDLSAPPDAEPLEVPTWWQTAFDPRGKWLASAMNSEIRFWPVGHSYASVLLHGEYGQTFAPAPVVFLPDGHWLASASHKKDSEEGGTVRLWPLSAAAGARGGVVAETQEDLFFDVDVDPAGRQLLTVSHKEALLVPVAGGEPRRLEGFSKQAQLGAGAFGPGGRSVAVASYYDAEGVRIRVWDLETGEVHVLDPREGSGRPENPLDGAVTALVFTPEGHLLSAGRRGLQRWNVETGSSELLWEPRRQEIWMNLAMSADGRFVVTAEFDEQPLSDTDLVLHDLEEHTSRPVTSHGRRVYSVALDPTGTILVTGDKDGLVRVGRLDGSVPYLFVGDTQKVWSTALSPDGAWIATGGWGGSLRLWPMPDLSKTPFHALPYEELLARLRSLTNLRAVPDAQSPGGYKIEIGPFPGWADVPEW